MDGSRTGRRSPLQRSLRAVRGGLLLPDSDVLVLCYHGVSTERRTSLMVKPEQLRRQLTLLVERGYRGARFAEAIREPGGGRRLVVSFDGAYRSVLELAWPILDSLELPGTVFVPTRFAGGGTIPILEGMESPVAGGRRDELEVMSWDELRLLSGRGWEIGSQTQTHPFLPALDDATLARELAGSRRDCEERVGVPCRSLAYPYGATDTRVMGAADRAGYGVAAGLPGRRFHLPLALNWPRVALGGADGRARFELKTAPPLRRLRAALTVATRPPHSRPARTPRVATDSGHEDPSQPAAPAGSRIAVIVPCFNDGELALDAVNSIQEEETVEVVVVDDASTDPGTERALDELRRTGVRVVRHEANRGLPAARMTGLAATQAPYVFPLDSDDLAVAGALGAMADRLDASPDAGACFGDYAEFGTRNRVRRVPARLDAYRVAYRNDYPVSSLFRRQTLDAVGGWQAVGDKVGYEDWNLWMTLAERGIPGIHWGAGTAFRRRLHGPRMLTGAAKQHIGLYATLRTLHPQLYAELRAHRRSTDLRAPARWLYPIVFGWRPPLSLRTNAERLLAAARGRAGHRFG